MFAGPVNDRGSAIQWPMILAVLSLMIIGAAFIQSATANNEMFRQYAWYRQPAFKQMIFYLLGLAGAAVVCLISYRRLARWSLVVYWFSILLLGAVLIPQIGTKVFGARRWIDLGFFNFQPSE